MIDSLLKRYSLIERPCDIGGSDWFVARDVFFEWWAEEPRSESSKSQGRLEIITWKQVLQFGSTPPTQDHPVASLEFFRSRFRILKPSLHPGDDDDIILGGGGRWPDHNHSIRGSDQTWDLRSLEVLDRSACWQPFVGNTFDHQGRDPHWNSRDWKPENHRLKVPAGVGIS